jgi:hypothetical protein
MAYYDEPNGTLKFAGWRPGGNGNCGGGYWQCDVIDDTGTSLTAMGASLAWTAPSEFVIAYQDASPDLPTAILKLARRTYSGNCGPYYQWQCDMIDRGGSEASEAGSVSVALDSEGAVTIAYHEQNTSYPGEGYLKFAYQRRPVVLPLVMKEW